VILMFEIPIVADLKGFVRYRCWLRSEMTVNFFHDGKTRSDLCGGIWISRDGKEMFGTVEVLEPRLVGSLPQFLQVFFSRRSVEVCELFRWIPWLFQDCP
jgi:hypothetical protein